MFACVFITVIYVYALRLLFFIVLVCFALFCVDYVVFSFACLFECLMFWIVFMLCVRCLCWFFCVVAIALFFLWFISVACFACVVYFPLCFWLKCNVVIFLCLIDMFVLFALFVLLSDCFLYYFITEMQMRYTCDTFHSIL